LKDEFDIHVPDLPGHGTMSMHDSSPTVELLAHFLNGYINEHELISPVIFGYSLGGYIALYHELMFPKRSKQVITFATIVSLESIGSGEAGEDAQRRCDRN
jgi:pimeloyl-ACP methyl ester carboxylesterase